MKNQKRSLKFTFKALIVILLVSYFAAGKIQSSFASNSNKEPNVIIRINSDRSITQYGSLFGQDLLYPSTVKDAERGIGGITGIIRIENQYGNVNIDGIGIKIKEEELIIENNYPKLDVYNSFLDNIKLKIEKGVLLFFDRTLADYASLRNFLYDLDDNNHRGLQLNPELSIGKGQAIDLKYTLHMVEEAGNELQAVTANMPIYINFRGSYDNGYDNDNKIGND